MNPSAARRPVRARDRRWWLWGCCLSWACGPQAADSPLHEYLAASGFSGSALVIHDNTQLLRAGFGLADAELQVPNHPDHVYGIGSLTKPITASAVLLAADQGHFELEDFACEHVPGCPPEWEAVQIAHLLNHTSGIPDLFGTLPDAPLLETTTRVDELLKSLGPSPLRAPAGSTYAYSNFNYVLLGYLIRATTGQDWEGYLRAAVLEPSGALDTVYDDVWEVVSGRARGYERRDGRLRHIAYDDHSAYAAGGLRSTLEDLRRWHEAFREGRIARTARLQAALSPNDGGYGYGWQIVSANGRELQNHTGGIGGYASHLAWYPDEALLIILLSNIEGEPVKALACDLARIVLEVTPQPRPTLSWLERDSQERCSQQPL